MSRDMSVDNLWLLGQPNWPSPLPAWPPWSCHGWRSSRTSKLSSLLTKDLQMAKEEHISPILGAFLLILRA